MRNFNYAEFIDRNLGFVSEKEQEILRHSHIFIPGVGGMGGTALACLARSGIEHFIISDEDTFEVSNLNRQIFSFIDQIDRVKAEVAKETLLRINPEIQVEIRSSKWIDQLDEILPKVDLVINGCDDTKATLMLMRKAQEHRKTVIDAFACTLPNVYVVRPEKPRPEQVMGFPTVIKQISQITEADWAACRAAETEYVLVHSSTGRHVVLKYAAEMISGKRKRISQAPMVWMTGILMAYEAIRLILKQPQMVDERGVFLNPWNLRYEKPLSPWVAWLKRRFVQRFLKGLQGD